MDPELAERVAQWHDERFLALDGSEDWHHAARRRHLRIARAIREALKDLQSSQRNRLELQGT